MRQQHLLCSTVYRSVSYVYLGGLVEGAVGVHVVVEDDDADHDSHAKQERVLAAETTRILPENGDREKE